MVSAALIAISAAVKPVVNPPTQTIDEGASTRFQCYVPGNPGARLSWRKEDGSAFGRGVEDSNGILTIFNAHSSNAGAYVCSAVDPHGGSPAHSSPVYLNVNPSIRMFPYEKQSWVREESWLKHAMGTDISSVIRHCKTVVVNVVSEGSCCSAFLVELLRRKDGG
ncbi:unnamed protein product [Toxocara canis]|uniref:Ig-like domain-containing protein n=1 Tax=Toxocara canis TaxID=6265 RepID=A0A183U9K9_TOXCA|nr:unnamed protein product [Toxocara canis]